MRLWTCCTETRLTIKWPHTGITTCAMCIAETLKCNYVGMIFQTWRNMMTLTPNLRKIICLVTVDLVCLLLVGIPCLLLWLVGKLLILENIRNMILNIWNQEIRIFVDSFVTMRHCAIPTETPLYQHGHLLLPVMDCQPSCSVLLKRAGWREVQPSAGQGSWGIFLS